MKRKGNDVVCVCTYMRKGKTMRSWLVKARQGDRTEGEQWSLRMVAAQILGTRKGIKIGPKRRRDENKCRG